MYNELTPDNWAAQYIDAYWIQFNKLRKSINIQIFPDGCIDIVYLFKNGKNKQFVVGCMTKPLNVCLEPSELMFGIRFKPGCAGSFLNISMKELTDKLIPLIEIRDLGINTIGLDFILNKNNLIPDMIGRKLRRIYLEKKINSNSKTF